MSNKIEKIISKMRQSNKGWDFESCMKVLVHLGYEMKPGKGDHFKFFKQGQSMIVMARHRPVSPAAVIDVLNAWNNKE